MALATYRNNIGLIRLILASFVIVGHVPEIIDGNRSREPLTTIFHTLSLGEVSVDAFFLLSGYLITKSAMRPGPITIYLQRRLMRIAPAFLVAFLICVFAIGPIFGARPWNELGLTLFHLLTLKSPPDYAGQSVTSLNGSMWSISYEFRCYLLVAVFRMCGLLNRRKICLIISACFMAAMIGCAYPTVSAQFDAISPLHAAGLIGQNSRTIRLTAIFLVGMVSFLYWPVIDGVLNGPVAGACALAALALMFFPHLAEAGVVVLGGFALFWLSLKANLGRLQRINANWDISYGAYLYGWPITIFMLHFMPSIEPLTLAMAVLPMALGLGAASWWGVEKWTKGLLISPRLLVDNPAV